MKTIAKILSAGISAFMLMSAPCISADAVSENCCNKSEIIAVLSNCNLSECGDIQSILSRIPCDIGSSDIDSLIGMLKKGGECPDGNCEKVPSQFITDSGSAENPETTPAKPAEKPQFPAEQPAEPDFAITADRDFNTAYEDEVIRLVNAERAKYGLSGLQKDNGAVSVAHVRAKEIVQSFSHTRPDGSSCFTAAKELGVSYSAAGENIAYGYADPQQVVNGWMNSEGHRKNILSSSFSKIGVGCYSSGNTFYWSQFFIG